MYVGILGTILCISLVLRRKGICVKDYSKYDIQ